MVNYSFRQVNQCLSESRYKNMEELDKLPLSVCKVNRACDSGNKYSPRNRYGNAFFLSKNPKQARTEKRDK